MPSIRDELTEGMKKFVAGSQYYRCANFIDPTRVPGYTCPLSYHPEHKGVFDQAGYDIDHILEVAEDGKNYRENLQALCVSCHRVKTLEYRVWQKKTQAKPDEEYQETELEEIVQNAVADILETLETNPKQCKKPGDMKLYFRDGLEIRTRYEGIEYTAVYSSKDDALLYEGEIFRSPGAFRGAVVESAGGSRNKSGAGWQRCYIRDASDNQILLKDLPMLEEE